MTPSQSMGNLQIQAVQSGRIGSEQGKEVTNDSLLETSKEEKTADLLEAEIRVKIPANKKMTSEISLDDVLEEELV